MGKDRIQKRYLYGSLIIAIVLVCLLTVYEHASATNSILRGEGTKERPYIITSEADFTEFANSVNGGDTYTGQYVRLDADINYSNVNKTIGEEDNALARFDGFFDGNGHKVSNVYITSENGCAGLFLNLSGIVCNLTIGSGIIKGEYAGAIVGSVYENAKILNCYNKAYVEGTTIGNIAGEFVGDIYNCLSYSDYNGQDELVLIRSTIDDSNPELQEASPEQIEDDITYLNHYLSALSTTYDYSNWCLWQHNESDVVLSMQKANVLNSISTQLSIDSNFVTINAYYGLGDCWYFALPSGYVMREMPILLEFADGSTERSKMSEDENEVNISKDGIDYKIVRLVNSNTPSIFLQTAEKRGELYLEQSKENYLAGNIDVLDETGKVSYKGVLESVSGRGNDSWIASKKKGYNLVLKDKVNLLNMGENEDYVLLSGFRDNSLLSYKITQDLEQRAGVKYAPESRFVSVYMNHTYLGMYLLTEKIEIDRNRIDIRDVSKITQNMSLKPLRDYSRQYVEANGKDDALVYYDIDRNPKDITGGYLLEMDKCDYTEEQSRFISNRGTTIVLKSDKYASKEQVEYIAEFWQNFEDALYSEDGYNAKGKYYTEYIDVESFANQWLIYEIASEPSISGSIYLYKESDVSGDGKLHASYAWDMEHSYLRKSQSLFLCGFQSKIFDNYWGTMYKHEDFAQVVLEQWENCFKPAIEDALNDGSRISLSDYQQQYQVSGIINQTRWPAEDWNDKVEIISKHLKNKKDLLDVALPKYQLGYDILCVEGGYLYGAQYNEKEDDIVYNMIESVD